MHAPLLILILISGSLLAPTLPQQPDPAGELAKAVQLGAQAAKLFGEQHYKEALLPAREVLSIRQRLLTPDDERIAFAFSSLGEIHRALKNEAEASKAFQSALAVYEKHPDKNVLMLAKTLEHLGHAFYLKGDFKGAEPLYFRAVKLQENLLGSADAQTILAMKNYGCISLLAGVERNLGKQKPAAGIDDETRALNSRATCWLSGFKDDCGSSVKQGTRDTVLNSRAVKLTTPPYPPAALQKHLSGVSFVAVLIDENGNVIEAKAICGGYAELDGPSIQAARASKFAPTTIAGQPVKVTGVIVYNFIRQ